MLLKEQKIDYSVVDDKNIKQYSGVTVECTLTEIHHSKIVTVIISLPMD